LAKKHQERRVNCRIRILKRLEDVWNRYQPIVGGIYDATFVTKSDTYKCADFCVIEIKGKQICVRKGEFELV
jgi:hypothetical protein